MNSLLCLYNTYCNTANFFELTPCISIQQLSSNLTETKLISIDFVWSNQIGDSYRLSQWHSETAQQGYLDWRWTPFKQQSCETISLVPTFTSVYLLPLMFLMFLSIKDIYLFSWFEYIPISNLSSVFQCCSQGQNPKDEAKAWTLQGRGLDPRDQGQNSRVQGQIWFTI